MIRDHRGRVPNYVIIGGMLRHQPTGIEIPCGTDYSNAALRQKMAELKHKIAKETST